MVNEETWRVKKIIKGSLPQESITVGSLKKTFGEVQAVKDISFSISRNESFILLGINGAGKSTTFRCLTAEEIISDGKILLNGKDIYEYHGNPDKMGGVIGYCPQTNPLMMIMTVKETLQFFAVLRGVSPNQASDYACSYSKKFDIHRYLNTLAY